MGVGGGQAYVCVRCFGTVVYVFREVGACLKRVCGVSEWVCKGVFLGEEEGGVFEKTGVRLGVRGLGLALGGG